MFGFAKRAAAEVAMNVILSNFKKTLEQNGEPVEPQVWAHPYLLGYAFTAVTSMLHEANGSSFREDKIGMQTLRCLAHLTGLPIEVLSRLIGEFAEKQPVEFERGSELGTLWALLMKRKANIEHPAVAELVNAARERNRQSMAANDDISDAAGLAVVRDLVLPLRELSRRRVQT